MNTDDHPQRIAYVLKRYPRYSETFVVNEILAHEAAGLDVSIFAVRPTSDTHFQHAIANVRAPVTYLRYGGIRADILWNELDQLAKERPPAWQALPTAGPCDGVEVYQAVALAREVIRRNIEHIHAHFATTATTVARLAAAFAGVPYSFTAHAKDIFHEYVDPIGLRQKIRDAATVITVSDYNVQFLRDTYPEVAGAVQRVYNGLDLKEFPFSRPHDRPTDIIAVGRLVEKKGFSDLVHACALLAQAKADFHCRIIGAGDLEEDIRALIHRMHLESHVELLGPRPMTEVKAAIQNSAVLVAPCITATTGDQDGLPTVLLEAMALGTPCVSTDVSGVPEAVRHEETGLIVPQKQPVQLAHAMERLIHDADLRVRLATVARTLIEEHFDVVKNAAQVREHFARSTVVTERARIFSEVG